MRNSQHTSVLLSFIFSVVCMWQVEAQSPKAKYGVFALTNATIETITKGTIENGTLVIQGGKIQSVGTDVAVPQNAEIIDCKGLRVYPGMIDGGTRVGLSEIGSDKKTQDFKEKGEVVPQVKALTAVNPNSVIIPVTRVNGVTTVIAKPEGGLFPGTAALINLHGYTPDQMYVGFECVVLNFPSTARTSYYDRRSDEDIEKAAEKSLKKLNEVWDRVESYSKIHSATKGVGMRYYPEMEALLPVVKGERSLMIEVNAENDIQAALKWVKEKNIAKVIFSGVAEGWRVADEIAEAGIPVIVGPVIALPTRAYDKYDRAYANPEMMRKAGVKVAIRTADNENARNLPYQAGFAAAYGMGRKEAWKAITIVPAEIFGVADRLGSIEDGKSATLLVSDGDPMETKTQIKHLFIDGWMIPLVSRHTLLYDEFLQRSPGVKKNK